MARDGGEAASRESSEEPGRRAIDAALSRLYGRLEPVHLRPILPWSLGGPDPLDGISAYPAAGPPPHWHLVSYGLSELGAKESDDESRSGYGFELTLRIPRAPGETAPPEWALHRLQGLARYVVDTLTPFGAGHTMDLNGPLASSSAITAVAFTPDPELPAQDTPNGRLEFLQVVGLTRDELELAQSWDTGRLLSELARDRGPLIVTDLERGSILAEPARRERILARAAAEGSSQSSAFVHGLAWEVEDGPDDEDRARLVLGAIAVGSLRRMLAGRTLHGRKFLLEGDREVVVVEPSESGPSWSIQDEVLVLRLDPPAARAILADLSPRRGTFSWALLPGLELVVRPTRITGPRGEVIETIG